MQYAKIIAGLVDGVILADAQFVAQLPGEWVDCTGKDWGVGWAFDGTDAHAPEPPAPTAEQVQAAIVQVVQQRLDAFAQTRNYDGILSACTYASSSVPKFAAEGQAAVDLRDATWATLYTLLAEVLAETRPMPAGFADVEPLLPTPVWPA